MKLHFAGKYNGDESTLPQREHPENYVPFKEFKSMKTFAVIMNIIAIVLTLLLFSLVYAVANNSARAEGVRTTDPEFFWGIIFSLVTLIPHEFLHAICFKKDVYMYNNLSQGMLFVIGSEDMSKTHFIMMSLCPNIVFGFIPLIIFLIFPNMIFFGALGALAIGSGSGDYYNIFNALTQVPKGAKIYMSGIHTYWYK